MKRICILGGGSGTSRLVKGFINKDVFVDVIVTSSDNGGHSGKLINEFSSPAFGDLRHVIESLTKEPLATFFKYRFSLLHHTNDVSLGNLMLLSLYQELGALGMLNTVNKMIEPNFRVHLSNLEYMELLAYDSKGNLVSGESNIGKCSDIKDLFFEKEPLFNNEVVTAILNADIIVLSFGSFYTSLGAVIVNNYLNEAIKKSKARLVYLPNLVNQIETNDYCLEDYLDFLEKTIAKKIDRVIIANDEKFIDKLIKIKDRSPNNYEFYSLVVIENNKLRHDIEKVSRIILEE